jgi:hypothetical protein
MSELYQGTAPQDSGEVTRGWVGPPKPSAAKRKNRSGRRPCGRNLSKRGRCGSPQDDSGWARGQMSAASNPCRKSATRNTQERDYRTALDDLIDSLTSAAPRASRVADFEADVAIRVVSVAIPATACRIKPTLQSIAPVSDRGLNSALGLLRLRGRLIHKAD